MSAPQLEIIVAQPHGFCGQNGLFGVSGAINKAIQAAQDHPDQTIYILGALVHNPHVTAWLAQEYGIHTVTDLTDIPAGQIMIIKSHGLPPQTIQAAQQKGLQLIDATCPMVQAVHRQVIQLAAQGKQILYLASDLHHEEALGVYGEAPEAITLITLADLPQLHLADPAQTILLSQTTLSILETKTALDALQQRYPTLTIEPHICPATTQRQQAVIDLAREVNLVIIVGSVTSSNSRRLQEVAAKQHVPSYIIDSAADLQPAWLTPDITRVGLSSGASTPEWLLDEVSTQIKQIKAHPYAKTAR